MDSNRFSCSSIFLFISSFVFPAMVAAAIGINYGEVANNLPSPENVIPLVRSIGATKLKLYSENPRILKAFANTGIEINVGLGNQYLAKMSDPDQAQAWVKNNIQSYLPSTKITCITVGNIVLTFNDTSLMDNLLPAMQNIHTALVNLNLDKQICVTTAHNLAILETSDPPSSGAFRRDLSGRIAQILDFHVKTGSPIFINAYPYFAYKSNPKRFPIDFVLFEANSGLVDPISNLRYDNMLFAQIDAVYFAMASLGYGTVSLEISETGWPSKGDKEEEGANIENAKKYNSNLMKMIDDEKKGTPLRPNSEMNVYVFALFNENMKPGPTSERNFGLFMADGTPAYSLGLDGGPTTSFGTPTRRLSPLLLCLFSLQYILHAVIGSVFVFGGWGFCFGGWG